jgi:hypothetical protein
VCLRRRAYCRARQRRTGIVQSREQPLRDPEGQQEVIGVGGVAAMGIREVLGVVSTFVPRDLIRPGVTIEYVRA